MVGWLFVDDAVLAPLHRYQQLDQSGLVEFACSGKLLADRSVLRGRVALELTSAGSRIAVRCLAARPHDRVMHVKAVALGDAAQGLNDEQADDYLIVDGGALSSVSQVRVGTAHHGQAVNVELCIPNKTWREERGRRHGKLALIPPAHQSPIKHLAGLIDLTPPLMTVDPLTPTDRVTIELVRLRERLRYVIEPYAADWQAQAAVMLANVTQQSVIASRRPQTATSEAITV